MILFVGLNKWEQTPLQSLQANNSQSTSVNIQHDHTCMIGKIVHLINLLIQQSAADKTLPPPRLTSWTSLFGLSRLLENSTQKQKLIRHLRFLCSNIINNYNLYFTRIILRTSKKLLKSSLFLYKLTLMFSFYLHE